MADMHSVSERMIDLAQRIADVGEASGGTRVRKGSKTVAHQVIDVAERL